MSDPRMAEWERGGYLPMDCPNCGRRRLMFDPGPPPVVECEKCTRDTWDSEEFPYPGSEKWTTQS